MAGHDQEGRPRPPGTVRPQRFPPRLHYELPVWGWRGHALGGTDPAELCPPDRIVADLQHGAGGAPVQAGHVGVLHDLDPLFSLRAGTLHVVGLVVAAYAALEGVEAVGLWFQRRWAEYLTFIATTALPPLEIFELTRTVSPLKVIALIVNVAVGVYLLRPKRLVGFN